MPSDRCESGVRFQYSETGSSSEVNGVAWARVCKWLSTLCFQGKHGLQRNPGSGSEEERDSSKDWSGRSGQDELEYGWKPKAECGRGQGAGVGVGGGSKTSCGKG